MVKVTLGLHALHQHRADHPAPSYESDSFHVSYSECKWRMGNRETRPDQASPTPYYRFTVHHLPTQRGDHRVAHSAGADAVHVRLVNIGCAIALGKNFLHRSVDTQRRFFLIKGVA